MLTCFGSMSDAQKFGFDHPKGHGKMARGLINLVARRLLRQLGSDNSHTRSVFGFAFDVVCARKDKLKSA